MTAFVAFGLVIIAVIVTAFAAMTLWARRHPLEAFIKLTRRALVRAGMMRRKLAIDGGSVVWFRGGSGDRTLVLVHGVNDQAGSWSAVVPRLLSKFRVVTVDLPGHGESEPLAGPLPMQLMVDGLAAVIEAESQSKPVILVGNSMGGWVSMLYASEHPDRVSQLVLEDASGLTWDVSHVPAFPANRDEAIRLLRMVHGPDAKIPEYLVDAMLRLALTLPQARVLQTDLTKFVVDDRVGRLTMPVTLIWGAHDGLLTLEYAELLRSRIPGSTLHVIETAAHSPHRQRPAEFTKLLLEAIE